MKHLKLYEMLEKSPLFQLSLSSKELFHSNFLFWIWKISANLFADIINGLCYYGEGCNERPLSPLKFVVKREKDNFDLSIWNKDTGHENLYMVIENKVKSIPRKSQLDDYYDKTQDSHHLLLSLAKTFPEKDKIKNKWMVVSYDTLSKVIFEKVLKDPEKTNREYLKDYPSELKKYYFEIIKDYWDMIKALDTLTEEWEIKDNSKFFYEDNKLEELRINDLKEKIRFSFLCNKVAEELKRLSNFNIDFNSSRKYIFEENKDYEINKIFLDFGMTRAQGLLELKILMEPTLALVIQIQGNQYRHCIELYEWNNKVEKNCEILTKERNIDWFIRTSYNTENAAGSFKPFKGSELPLEIRPTENGRNGELGFNKYGDQFIYQSIIIPENTTIKEIISHIINDVQEIHNHRNS